MKFELEFVGYMNFKNRGEALKVGYELEKQLGELTKDNINLYLSNVKHIEEFEEFTDDESGIKVGINCEAIKSKEQGEALKQFMTNMKRGK